MAPVSKTSDTPNSAVNRSTNSENQTPASASSDQGGQANSATRSFSNSSPFVAPKSRWFNTNILGKAVDAFQEDDLLQVMKTSEVLIMRYFWLKPRQIYRWRWNIHYNFKTNFEFLQIVVFLFLSFELLQHIYSRN